MSDKKVIKNVLISVFNKTGLEPILNKLNDLQVQIYSTGGTAKFIKNHNIPVNLVEDLTTYPSILGGRVKTLHPKIFGGILSRRDDNNDRVQIDKYKIIEFDLVIVDLYPFEETVNSGANEKEIIEKIDIGGISLIRAAAKNYNDVFVVSAMHQYSELLNILNSNGAITNASERKKFARHAFKISSKYDREIYKYFNEPDDIFDHTLTQSKKLRYGENPHQKGIFFGDLDNIFSKLNGKELSYNNLLDIDSAVNLISEFNETTFIILKHNNACGVASREELSDAWRDALAGDPISAFGGVLICNREIDPTTAKEIDKIFYEVLIAPSFSSGALDLLKKKEKRILLQLNSITFPEVQFRTILNGVLQQEKDLKTDDLEDVNISTKTSPTDQQLIDLLFASKICKHTKSNTIVLAKNKQLISSGVGQTSRVDALKQAIKKAEKFKFNLDGSVMASDAFFPFPDCVEIGYKSGIKSVIQPGGSIKDQLTIDYCNKHQISMVLTGVRHFKH